MKEGEFTWKVKKMCFSHILVMGLGSESLEPYRVWSFLYFGIGTFLEGSFWCHMDSVPCGGRLGGQGRDSASQPTRGLPRQC